MCRILNPASIVSIAQHIVNFDQNVDDQALLGGKKVLLPEKMTILNYFRQRCSIRKKGKIKTNKTKTSLFVYFFLLCLLITWSEIRRLCSNLDWFWGHHFASKSYGILTAKSTWQYLKVRGQIAALCSTA